MLRTFKLVLFFVILVSKLNAQQTINFSIPACPWLSTQEMSKPNSINVYPNPASDKLYVKFEGVYDVLEVYNNMGEKLIDIQKTVFQNKEIVLNTTTLADGVYIIQLIYADKTYKKKFIISKK